MRIVVKIILGIITLGNLLMFVIDGYGAFMYNLCLVFPLLIFFSVRVYFFEMKDQFLKKALLLFILFNLVIFIGAWLVYKYVINV